MKIEYLITDTQGVSVSKNKENIIQHDEEIKDLKNKVEIDETMYASFEVKPINGESSKTINLSSNYIDNVIFLAINNDDIIAKSYALPFYTGPLFPLVDKEGNALYLTEKLFDDVERAIYIKLENKTLTINVNTLEDITILAYIPTRYIVE